MKVCGYRNLGEQIKSPHRRVSGSTLGIRRRRPSIDQRPRPSSCGPLKCQVGIAYKDGPTRRSQRAVGSQRSNRVPLAWRGVVGDQNPLWNVESLDRAPISIAFAIYPDLTVVVNTCFELHPDTGSSVATDGIWECHVDPIPGEGEPVGTAARSGRGTPPNLNHRTRLGEPDSLLPEPPNHRWAHQARSP